jgi:integrase
MVRSRDAYTGGLIVTTPKTNYRKSPGDPTGLCLDARTGVYYFRRKITPTGGKASIIVRSLKTKNRTEAIKRLQMVAAQVRIETLDARPMTLKENVDWWRKHLATDSSSAGLAFDDEIERRLGPVVGQEMDELGEAVPVYGAGREADTVEFANLVSGRAVPVEFYLPDYVSAQDIKLRYASRTKRAIDQLAEFMRGRPQGNRIDLTRRRDASDFINHLAKTEGSLATAKAKRSALSAYWDWLVTREDARENIWTGHKMPKGKGKTDMREFTTDEMVALLEGTAAQPMADFIRVAALTGMRREEIALLRVEDTVGDWFNIREGKTAAATRRLPIHSGLTDIVTARSANKGPTDFLFHDLPKSGGKGRGRSEKIGERFTTYRRRVGADDLRDDGRSRVDLHSFRRWFVTEAVRHSGQPVHVVSEIVGHSEGRSGMTIGTYAGGSLDVAKTAVVESVKLPPHTYPQA